MLVKIACFCIVVVSVAGAPTDSDKEQPTVIPIISQSEEVETNGTYKFSFETGNGIKREESSYDKVLPKVEGRSAGGEESNDTSDEIHVQTGSYSYTAPDGTLISVRYIADENGFQPIGDHIPSVSSSLSTSFGTKEKSGRALSHDSAETPSAPTAVAKTSPNKDTKPSENLNAKITASEEPNTVDSKNEANTNPEVVTMAAKAESSETTESTEKTTNDKSAPTTIAEPASTTVSDKSTEAPTSAEASSTEASSITSA